MSEQSCTSSWHVYAGTPTPGQRCKCGEKTFQGWDEDTRKKSPGRDRMMRPRRNR